MKLVKSIFFIQKLILQYIRIWILILIIPLFINKSYSQFYNGSQMTFGKNRVQFEERYWSYLRFKRYDVYYYKEGKPLAVYTARFANKMLTEYEKKLQYTLENKIQFIIYNKYSDLKQSNIGLTDENAYNTGGVTHIIGTKVFIYFNGDHKFLEQQIKYGIAKIIFNQILFGQSYLSRVKNSTLINFPDWYVEGFLKYISTDWNEDIENKVMDGIMSGKYKQFNRLQGEDAICAGFSIWKYIELKYGEAEIPNIIYMAKTNRNVENGFMFVIGINFKTLVKDWYNFYYNYKYLPIKKETTSPSDTTILSKIKKSRVYQQLKVNNTGDYAAYTTNELGQYKVWIYDMNRKKAKWIMKREHKLDEKADFSYPILAWHPSGKILSIVLESKGKTWLYFYSMETHSFEKRPIYLFDKILDFSYNDKGDKFVMSAIQKGRSDIFVYNIASNTFEAITKDIYDDFNPRFINNSRDIIFSSNRPDDTLRDDSKEYGDDFNFTNNSQNIFIYHYSRKSELLFRITNEHNAIASQPEQYDKQHVTYLSNENGINNRYIAKLDSSVSFVDTTVHYKQFVTTFPASNNFYNIVSQSFSPKAGKYAESFYKDGADKMYINDIKNINTFQAMKLINYEPKKREELKPKTTKTTTIGKSADTSHVYMPPVKPKHKGFTGVYSSPSNPKDSSKTDIKNYTFSKKTKDKILSASDSTIVSLNSSTTPRFTTPGLLTL